MSSTNVRHATDPDPALLPWIQVDRGAIKFLLSGANVMSPGLTSAGGHLPDASNGEKPLAKGTPVAIRSQGKQHEVSVGVLLLGTDEIKTQGKGNAVDNVHYLGGTSRFSHRRSLRCVQPRGLPVIYPTAPSSWPATGRASVRQSRILG